jgi:hypothetical protein
MSRVWVVLIAVSCVGAAQKPKPAPVKPSPVTPSGAFVNPYTADELRNQQAVIETAMGTIVLDLLSDAAPTHVAHFVKTARDGEYDGTLFHRVIKHGIIQGGDPLSKDPAGKDRYGTGGLNRLKRELNRNSTRAARCRQCWCRIVRTAPEHSFSSALPTSLPWTGSTRCLPAWSRAFSSRRRSPRRQSMTTVRQPTAS